MYNIRRKEGDGCEGRRYRGGDRGGTGKEGHISVVQHGDTRWQHRPARLPTPLGLYRHLSPDGKNKIQRGALQGTDTRSNSQSTLLVRFFPNHTCCSSLLPFSLLVSTFTTQIKLFTHLIGCIIESSNSSNKTVTSQLQSSHYFLRMLTYH